MLALPGIVGLVIFLYLRPQEFVPGLSELPFLHVSLGVCVLGIAYDVLMRRTLLAPTPQLRWVLLFAAWCLVGLAYFQPAALLSRGTSLLAAMAITSSSPTACSGSGPSSRSSRPSSPSGSSSPTSGWIRA